MAILAGIDEAGLGPRLGPLVVGLAVFRGPQEVLDRLFEALAPAVGPNARAFVPVGDSKRLFGASRRLRVLERGIYPFLRLAEGPPPRTLAEWMSRLDVSRPREDRAAVRPPWYEAPLELPRALDTEGPEEGAERLAAACSRAGVEPVEIRTVVVPEDEVNRGLARCGSKNVLNFEAAGPLIRRVFDAHAGTDEPVEIVVDRQGGRKDYAPLLRRLFYPAAVSPRAAPADTAAYTVRDDDRRADVRFVIRADRRFLPVGLASMVAKYTRELHMTLLNRYWQAHVPDLKPTAGYPADAVRFLNEIESRRRAAGISLELLVRRR